MAVAAGKSEQGVMEAWLEGEGAGAGVGTEALLHAATRAGKVEVVKTMLDRRTVAVDLKDEEGDTALHVAARCTSTYLHLTLFILTHSGAASMRSCNCSWLPAQTSASLTWPGRRPWPCLATCPQTSPR